MINFILLIVGLSVLILGAEGLVKGASSLALSFKISPLVVGLTIVAFGTSAPELFVSIKSALEGHPDLAFGNVIGSNICNITLILGVTALIFPVAIQKNILKFDWPVAFLSILLLYILTLDHNIDKIDAAIFVLLIIIYNVVLIRKSRKETKIKIDLGEFESKPLAFIPLIKDLFFIVLGSIGLVFGAEWLVDSASIIALDFGISKRIVGLTVIAFGTSAPELITSVVAAYRKNSDLGIGNLIGSNIFNVLSILGITGLIQEIHVDELFSNYDIFWAIGSTAVLYPLMRFRNKVSKPEGAFLLLIYIAYISTLVVWNIH